MKALLLLLFVILPTFLLLIGAFSKQLIYILTIFLPENKKDASNITACKKPSTK